MEHCVAGFFSSGGDEEVRDLAATFAAGGKQTLYLAGPPDVLGGGFHKLEGIEGAHKFIPLGGIAG